MLGQNKIEKLREELIKELINYEGEEKLKLNITKPLLNSLVFTACNDYKVFAIPFELLKKLDLSKLSFDKVRIVGLDFTGTYGVKINPQQVWNKNFYNVKLNGVELIGPFYGAKIRYTDFTGSKGALIDSETLLDSIQYNVILRDAEVLDNVDGEYYKYSNFEGTKDELTKFYKYKKKKQQGVLFKEAEKVESLDELKEESTIGKTFRLIKIDFKKVEKV